MVHPFASEKIWFDKSRVEEAEYAFYAKQCGCSASVAPLPIVPVSSLVSEIKNIKDHIKSVLGGDTQDQEFDAETMQRIQALEKENKALRTLIEKLEQRVATLEISKVTVIKPACDEQPADSGDAPADDDDLDLFGSDDEEDEEAEKLKAERVAAYAAKKANKPVLIAKSNIILDVKPWDDETDMAKLEECVRSVQMDGLVWGASKLVPVGYGIKKLQITCVVEDDKVGTDDLDEKITAFEDYVQSVDIAAFNKI